MHYRVSNEYGADWPLWGPDGQRPDGDPSLPAWLETDLRAWANDFNKGYSYESGWPTEQSERDHKRVAERLIRQVSRVVELDGDTAELQYWETNHRMSS